MSDVGECSRPKKQRITHNLPLNDSDIENDLHCDDSSDDIFSEDCEQSDEDNQLLSFSAEAIYSPHPVSTSSVNNEEILLDKTNPPSPGNSQPQQVVPGPTQNLIKSSWSTEIKLKNISFQKQNIFYGNPGSERIDFFNFFFEDELLQFICEKTNAQAAKLLQISTAKHSRIKLWKDVTISELKIFLGLLFHTGTIPLSRLQDYWKTDRLFAIPIFREQMSRNRFLLIMKCLHFTSETKNPTDPLFKIRHMIEYFNNKMEACYYPAKELCLDESMVLWRGRLRCTQNKRHKNGIKLYTLTEPDGIILKFCAHAGHQDVDISGKDHVERVVMQLLEKILQSGHSVYMDNYYNSVGLARKLLDNQTYCTGILKQDLKENPEEISKTILRKGENMAVCKDGVIVGRWKDEQTVMYISTEFPSHMTPVTSKRGQTTIKPLPIAKYNEFMTGIDRQDQLLSFYPCERQTLRWHLKLAIHIFHLLFINSYKIYKYSGNSNYMNFYDYRLAVINQMLPEKPVPAAGPSRRYTQLMHKISKITEKNSKGILKRKMCRQSQITPNRLSIIQYLFASKVTKRRGSTGGRER